MKETRLKPPKKRPASVPDSAVWDANDGEWVQAAVDSEGNMHGLVTYWRANGILVCECKHEHGTPHGGFKRYHESGEVSQQGTYVQGQMHGTRIFLRSDKPTTETLPEGLSGKVWRAEMDVVMGQVVAARCFDRQGRQVTEDGNPVPDRPTSVPESATFTGRGTWLAGVADDQYRRDGLWRYWDSEGVLIKECVYEHGEEVSVREFANAEEAAAVVALRERRIEDALVAARGWWAISPLPDDELAAAGGLLLEVLATADAPSPGRHRDEILAVAHAVVEGTRDAQWGPFLERGKRAYLGRQRALDTLARDVLARGEGEADLAQALAWSEAAVGCDMHYGQDHVHVTQILLLKRLGKDDEAFQRARDLLERSPDVHGLDEIRRGLPEWLASFEAMTLAEAGELLGRGGSRLADLVAMAPSSPDGEEDEEEDDEEASCRPDQPWNIGAVLDGRCSLELGRWGELLDHRPLPNTYRGAFLPPTTSSLGDAIAAEDGRWVARLRGLFCAMSPVLLEDEEIFFAAWAGDASSNSPVYYSHQDEVEIVKHRPSLAALLVDRLLHDQSLAARLNAPVRTQERWKRALALLAGSPSAALPAHLDPELLQRRTGWIVTLFLDVDVGLELEELPSLEAWQEERELCDHWPHLQAYWLLHHLVFDNREELPGLIEKADMRYPPNAELVELAKALVAGRTAKARFWDVKRIRGYRRQIFAAGLTRVFTADALKRIRAKAD